ncbi:uncharacterized protein LOC117583246 [Drosophila guanche]|uniref:DUF4777 domain-containing protein n=1 Tax=Drosophila guanche TaxID=7266 RepID=A0A3B0JYR2_DROGU|nr:uncharacterized protein LOC117583246 [Drosophila guanche]SPP80650.1 Hypothetical predicted protein [Drosophila guanche]
MALIYYDRTINNPLELILAGLRENSQPTSLETLSVFVATKTGFPAEVCHKIIREALEEGMASKTIRQVDELYYAVPPKPRRLPKRNKPKDSGGLR